MIMKLLSTVFSALIALNPFAAQSSSEEKGGVSLVKKLSETDYDSFVKNDMTLVEFFAPWCGHCKKLAPEYEKAAETLEKKNIFLGSVDCTEQKEVCAKNHVQGYPTLKIFRQGQSFEYQGPRDAEGIIRYMTKQSEPAVSELDAKKLDEFIKSDEVVFISNFPPESSEAKLFESVANKYRNDFSFGKVNIPPLAVYKKFDEGYAVFSPPGGKYDEEGISEFVRGESIRLVDEIGPENYAKYMESGKPLAYLFYGSEDQKKSMSEAYEAAIKPYKGKIHAVFIDADKFGQHADVLNLEKKWPGFVIHDMSKEHKFPFSGKQLDAEALKEFVRSFSEGKLKPSFKSEPIPEKQEGSVKVIVHENFNDVVLDDKKDVLVEVYAPWCGACKNLAPTYEKLAEKYATHSDKIVIAKFDGIANDLPETVVFKLQHFPTLLLFKAQKGKRGNSKACMVEYSGGPNLNALIDFISKEATNKVTVEKETEPEAKKEEEEEESAEKAEL